MSMILMCFKRFAAPVRAHFVFFVALVLMLSVSPVWTTFAGGHIYRFMLACFLESISIAYLAALILIIIGPGTAAGIIKWVILIAAGLWALGECFTIATTGRPIDQAAIALLHDTDRGEIKSFFHQYFSVHALAGIVRLPIYLSAMLGAAVYLAKLKFIRRSAAIILPFAVLAGTMLLCRIGSFVTIRNYDELLVWVGQGSENPELIHYYELDYTPAPIKGAYIVKINRMENREIAAFDALQAEIFKHAEVSRDTTRNFNVLVIIGESMIRLHSSLYGYRLRTNPVLEAERDSGRLTVFTQMETTANYTTTAIRNLLSTADLDRGERWTDGAFFPLILKRAGFDVSIFDNQFTDARSDTGLGRVLYSPLNLAEVYTTVGDSIFEFDGQYAKYVNSRIDTKQSPQCLIYHLKGQHFDAADRFDTAPHFTAKDITIPDGLTEDQRRDIANYDSATYYNDSIVGALLHPWQQVPTIAFYFSDHGEDIADLGEMGARNSPRPDDPAWVDRQFHIPFFVWMSHPFIETYPELVAEIKADAETPESLDHFGINLLNLLGIKYNLK